MEITGILVKQTDHRKGVSKKSGQPWEVAEYLVEIPGQFVRHINFSVKDGQVGRLARFESLVGKMVTVSFDIDAHEHDGRWFNEINAWGILEYITTDTRQANIAAAQQQDGGTGAAPAAAQDGTGEKKDGLPF